MILLLLSLATFGACMNYSDYLGRNISLPLSAALYSPNPPSCLQKRLNATVMKEFSVELDGGSVSGLIVTIPYLRTVALTFKSIIPIYYTDTRRSLAIFRFRVELLDPSDFEHFEELYIPLVKWQHRGRVSKLLAQAYRRLWQNGRMRKRFQKVMAKRSTQKVLITGYSLGGGVAALVAVDIVKEDLAKKDQVTLITLGQTMVGEKTFAEEYEQQVEHSYRVVRRGDFVPQYPGQHRSYEYNGKEVYYKKYGMGPKGSTGFEVCEHNDCSGKQVNPLESMYNDVYFKRNVTEYGLKCK
ncbi:triacylglycerol lipase [Ancylostoma caninum]|uniref:Triacylglycerol lipase n=1 Tax=Ancylostoma caninum TaxID=29170 RepID=A0A368FM26_ANCCA|nr:triacylglycerol lipase [Ancylostoma caninum]